MESGNITSLPQNNATQLGSAQTIRTEPQRAEIPVARVVETKGSSDPTLLLRNTDEARQDAVKRLSAQVATDIFVVTDTRFTIYKDTSGTYFTRYTDLRDGTVKIVPEKQLFELAGVNNIGGSFSA